MDLLFSFQGRINRAKWWLGAIILMIINWVLMAVVLWAFGSNIDPATFANENPTPQQVADLITAFVLPILLVSLIMLYPALALYAKRWHDRNKSGWWTLILLVPLVGPIWAFIELGLLKGTDGDNRFGPDPLR